MRESGKSGEREERLRNAVGHEIENRIGVISWIVGWVEEVWLKKSSHPTGKVSWKQSNGEQGHGIYGLIGLYLLFIVCCDRQKYWKVLSVKQTVFQTDS